MKINPGRMKIWVCRILIGISGVVCAAIPASAQSIYFAGPRVVMVNTTAVPLPAGSDFILSGQIGYATPPSAGNYGGTVYSKIAGGVQTGSLQTMVKKWAPLAISGSGLAKLSRVAIQAGAMVAGSLLVDWATKKAIGLIDGRMQKTAPAGTSGTLAPGATAPPASWASVDHWGEHPNCTQQADNKEILLLYPNVSEGGAAADAAGAGGVQDCGGGWCSRSKQEYFLKTPDCPTNYPKNRQNTRFAWPSNAANSWWVTPTATVDMSADDIETALSGSLSDPADPGHNEARRIADAAVGSTGAALTNANEGWPNQTTNNWGPTYTSPEHQTTIQNTFDNSITNDQKTIILNEGDTINNNGQVPVDPANPQQPNTGLTKAEVTAAINDSASGAGTVTPLTAESNPSVPDETPIAGYLDSFWEAIKALPLVSLLTDIHITSSGGSPIVNVTLPYIFSSGSTTIEMNFSEDGLFGVNYGYFLTLIGNVVLAFCGVRWTMYLFSSGD